MLPQRHSILRPVFVAAMLSLSLSAVGSAHASRSAPTRPWRGRSEAGPIVPESYQAGGPQQRTNTGQASSSPVLTPGYFEVVCPAMCYGAAFHVCGCRAYGGAGYYGPFRRLWGYGTYGPNFNMGPESPQYGLMGCQYMAVQAGHGLVNHHCGDCGCHHCCGDRGSVAWMYGDGGVPPIGSGTNPAAPPTDKKRTNSPRRNLSRRLTIPLT